jgi:NadR type nicotinamide-nucleotide adenylyltransferase
MIKIALIGPESSGKTTLCQQMAAYFNGMWVAEYARDYLIQTAGYYDICDLDIMAQDQFDLWQEIPQNNAICFYDTEMINFKIWSLDKYDHTSKLILGLVDAQQFDLFLLCKPDIEWIQDPLREFSDLNKRKHLFEIYKNELIQMGQPFEIIEGNYAQRTESAKIFIGNLINEVSQRKKLA